MKPFFKIKTYDQHLKDIQANKKMSCSKCGYTTTGNIHTHHRNCPKGGKCTFQYT